MPFLRPLLPWLVSVLVAVGIIGMQLIGGGGRPMFPLLVCYVPIVLAGILSLPLVLSHGGSLPRPAPLVAFVIMAAYLVGRSLWGGSPAVRDFELMRLGGILLVYLIFASAVVRSSHRLFFVWILLGSACFQTLAEMWQIFGDPSWMPVSGMFPELRCYNPVTIGTFANKNHIAWLLGDASLLALALGCWGRLSLGVRLVAFAVAALCGSGVALALSRGGVLSLCVGLLLFGFLSIMLLLATRERRALRGGIIVAVLLVLAGAMVVFLLSSSHQVHARMQRLWMDTFREDLWRAAVHDLGVSPFLGEGAGSFRYAARLMMPFESLLAHNDFAQLFSEFGLIGLLLVSTFLSIHMGGGFRVFFHAFVDSRGGCRRLPSNTTALLTGSLAVALAQIIHSFFDFNMHAGANALLAGVVFGILCNPGLGRSVGDREIAKISWIEAGMLLLLCFVVGLPILRDWRAERCFFPAEQVQVLLPLMPGKVAMDKACDAAAKALRATPSGAAGVRYSSGLGDLLWYRAMSAAQPDSLGKDLSLAMAAFSRCAIEDKGDWFVRMRLGSAAGRMGDEVKAREAFLQAMQRMPLFALPCQEYAQTLAFMGLPSEASHYYRISSRLEGGGDHRHLLKRMQEGTAPRGSR
jgi:hypothetical protein